ncbi:hypothetical protein JCM19232_4733 [Vibrio ishigakensis]|uniref:Uncharacterized protein n=1 Tax=Vibrio ishigakensis TaxID=1481914 RepID=A0A0B8P9L1_9VIBR|nr:hypothetical protein JCM19232_4733 [Vibrio ishigakensis]
MELQSSANCQSATDGIVGSDTGGVGSTGQVWMSHPSLSELPQLQVE